MILGMFTVIWFIRTLEECLTSEKKESSQPHEMVIEAILLRDVPILKVDI